MGVDVLEELSEWAGRGGYHRLTDGGTLVIADAGGEIRYYVRGENGEWTLSRAERAGDEVVLMRSLDLTHIERFLIERIGGDLRAAEGLEPVLLPYRLEDVAAGYRIEVAGDAWADLLPVADGRRVAGFLHTSIPYLAVGFSWYADADPAALRRSYDAVDGQPLLSRFVAQR